MAKTTTDPKAPAAHKPALESTTSLNDLKTILQEMPERPKPLAKLTVKNLIAELKPYIAGLRNKNYTDEEIVKILIKHTGVKMSVATMRNYMQEHASPTGGKFGVAKPRKASRPTAESPLRLTEAHHPAEPAERGRGTANSKKGKMAETKAPSKRNKRRPAQQTSMPV